MSAKFSFFEHENNYFRRADRGRITGVDQIFHEGKWVPYRGDHMAPVVFGDRIEEDEVYSDNGPKV